jgi:putative tricarboxylic transport membrane protein
MDPKTKDIISSILWLLLSVYIATESYKFGLGKWYMPGPGYFPFSAGLFLGLISLFVLVKTLINIPPKEIPIPVMKGHWLPVFLSILSMVLYVLFLNKAGFIFCTFFLAVFFVRVIAKQRLYSTLIIAVCCTLGSYLLFNVLLDAQLPMGFLGF